MQFYIIIYVFYISGTLFVFKNVLILFFNEHMYYETLKTNITYPNNPFYGVFRRSSLFQRLNC